MIRIKYKYTQEIKQSNLVHLIILVDEEEKRQLVVITDKATAMHITATNESQKQSLTRRLFFERSALYVAMSLIPEEMKKLMFIHIDGLRDSQYHAHLVRRNADINETPHELRISEAVLLSIVSGIPMYIDDHLWRIQSTPHNANSNGTQIPTNTLPLPMLKKALQEAIDREDYEAAKVLNEEIHNRFPEER